MKVEFTVGESGQLWLSHLTKEHSNNTCGPYLYTITEGATAHTAFVTRQGLQRWLSERGLVIDDSTVLEERGTSCRIVGIYRHRMHMCSRDAFQEIKGEHTRTLSNGEYTDAILTVDHCGIVTVHIQNVNCRDRLTYNYRESRKMMS